MLWGATIASTGQGTQVVRASQRGEMSTGVPNKPTFGTEPINVVSAHPHQRPPVPAVNVSVTTVPTVTLPHRQAKTGESTAMSRTGKSFAPPAEQRT